MLARFLDRAPAVLLLAAILPCVYAAAGRQGDAGVLGAAAPVAVLLLAYLAAGRRQRRRS